MNLVFLPVLTHVAVLESTSALLLNTEYTHFALCIPICHATPMSTAQSFAAQTPHCCTLSSELPVLSPVPSNFPVLERNRML